MVTVEELDTQISDLKFDFIVSVSVLGAVCLLLIMAVLVLIHWNYTISKKVKKLDPFVNFRLQRPKLGNDDTFFSDHPPPTEPRPVKNNNSYDNFGYVRNHLPQNTEKQERRDLNPIALRSKASIDNGNFIFGNPNNVNNNKSLPNSFRNPDYLDLDNRFY